MLKSPRYLRQDTITLFVPHKEEFDVFYVPYPIQYVRVDENYGISQSSKGIATENKVSVTVDLSDIMSDGYFMSLEDFQQLLIKGETLMKIGKTDDRKNAFTYNEVNYKKGLATVPSFLDLYFK